MILYTLLIIVSLLGVLAIVFAGSRDRSGYSWVQFYARGKDAGFALKEIELLRQVAKKADMEDPAALFWSVNQLDQCISGLLRKARLTGAERTQETQDFLSKLYAYRKRIELDQPRYKKGIQRSRSISESQEIKVLVDGVGVFYSRVLANSDRGLTISRPIGAHLPPSFAWNGRRIAIYFYRREDAGYVFDSTVLDEVSVRSGSALQIAHSETLLRTQKRRSVRAKTQISAYLYILKVEEQPEKIEVDPGLRCIVEDLSDTGCSVTVGGRAPAGLRVKVQFALEGDPVAISGVVRSSDYTDVTNRSLLHIEADTPSLTTRNRILALVFGVNANDDPGEDFFRLEDEKFALADRTASEIAPYPTEAAPSTEEPEFPVGDPSVEQGGPVEDAGGKV